MFKKILLLLFIIATLSSCKITGQSINNENDNLYIEALNCVFDFRFDNKHRLDNGVLNIYEKYYIDTKSLYYQNHNFSFHLEFIDSTSHPYKNATKVDWNSFKTFSSFCDVIGTHNKELSVYKHSNLRFLSNADIEERKKQNDVFIYSPLIPFGKDHYLIYETFYYPYSEYDYVYKLKKVDVGFEFISFSHYADFLTSKVDYMKTINFDQTYEEYMANRK